MTMELRNCPDEYFDNCKNRYIKCDDCFAGGGNSNLLYYRPVEGKKSNHPAYEERKQQRKSQRRKQRQQAKPHRKKYRKAIKKEHEVSDAIKNTVASGSVNQDGDYQLLQGEIQADHKYHSKSKGFTLSAQELSKGRNQGTNTWFITNKDDETMVVMPLEVYKKLINMIYHRSEDEPRDNDDGSDPTGQESS